jgi:hypothetical protein
VQLYRYFVSQSSKFCCHNPLCCFLTSVYCCKRMFRYRLSPETFGYTLLCSIALEYGLNDREFESRKRVGIFLFTTAFRPALGPTQSPILWVQGALSVGVNRPGREADHSPPSSAKVKNAWSYTSTSQYDFMAWYLVKAQGQLYFILGDYKWCERFLPINLCDCSHHLWSLCMLVSLEVSLK